MTHWRGLRPSFPHSKGVGSAVQHRMEKGKEVIYRPEALLGQRRATIVVIATAAAGDDGGSG